MEHILSEIQERATILLAEQEEKDATHSKPPNYKGNLDIAIKDRIERASQLLFETVLFKKAVSETQRQEVIQKLTPYQKAWLEIIDTHLAFQESEKVQQIAREISRQEFTETYRILKISGLRGHGNTTLLSLLPQLLPNYSVMQAVPDFLEVKSRGIRPNILTLDSGYLATTFRDYVNLAISNSTIKLIIAVGEPT